MNFGIKQLTRMNYYYPPGNDHISPTSRHQLESMIFRLKPVNGGICFLVPMRVTNLIHQADVFLRGESHASPMILIKMKMWCAIHVDEGYPTKIVGDPAGVFFGNKNSFLIFLGGSHLCSFEIPVCLTILTYSTNGTNLYIAGGKTWH